PASQLRLRLPRPSDKAAFCSLYADAETMKFIAAPLDRREATLKFGALLEANEQLDGARFFAIGLDDRARAAGFCGFQLPDARMRGAEIGIVLDAFARGKGHGPRVLGALVDAAF